MNTFKYISMLMMTIIMISCHNIENHPFFKKGQPQIETVEHVVTPQENAFKLIELKNVMRENTHIDSVFMSLPDEIILRIALAYPELSYDELTSYYLINKDAFEKLMESDKELRHYKDLEIRMKGISPDSIPQKPKQDIKLNNLNLDCHIQLVHQPYCAYFCCETRVCFLQRMTNMWGGRQ